MKCPHCNIEAKEITKFCAYCGKKMLKSMRERGEIEHFLKDKIASLATTGGLPMEISLFIMLVMTTTLGWCLGDVETKSLEKLFSMPKGGEKE